MKQSTLILGALALIIFHVGQLKAGVLVGTDDTTNVIPFGNAVTYGAVEYQQVYASSAFSGPTTFNTVSFFADPNYQTSAEPATIEIFFSTTSAAVNGLSTSQASNVGADNTLFGTFTLGGPSPTS